MASKLLEMHDIWLTSYRDSFSNVFYIVPSAKNLKIIKHGIRYYKWCFLDPKLDSLERWHGTSVWWDLDLGRCRFKLMAYYPCNVREITYIFLICKIRLIKPTVFRKNLYFRTIFYLQGNYKGSMEFSYNLNLSSPIINILC